MLAERIIHYTIEVNELLLHGKNANFVDSFWKNASKFFVASAQSGFRLLLLYSLYQPISKILRATAFRPLLKPAAGLVVAFRFGLLLHLGH